VARERLQSELQGRDDKTKGVYMTEPIEDVLAISGYALVYAELDKKDFWNFVKAIWDKYLNERPNPTEVMTYLLSAIAFRRSLFAILPRDLHRSAWAQDLNYRLRQRGLADDLFGPRIYGHREARPRHQSALIRVLARNSLLFEKGADMFASIYLIQRPEAKGIDLPQSVSDFARRVNRETQEGPPEDETPDEA